MIIEPKVRGFICTAAHPVGCEKAIEKEIAYAKMHGQCKGGPRNVLVIGASTGYGLASRIEATFGANAKTIGVFYERPADERRTASAGWYNTAAFEKIAHREGRYAKSINGDAFSDAIREQTAALIRKDLGQIDLLVYSLASPRRRDPVTGEIYNSVLKPVGKPFHGLTVDAFRGEVKTITIEPASPKEVSDTVSVMGGLDWERWMDFLAAEKRLSDGIRTVAYSYIGPALTHAVYRDGTIGAAKKHLHQTAKHITAKLQSLHGQAVISVNKAVVTQASAAIPVVPLYISLLFRYMKEAGTHENCIEQIVRLFTRHLYTDSPVPPDAEGLIRLDDLEMAPEIQQKIAEAWPTITTDNLERLTDIAGYRSDFYQLFGFGMPGVDYAADVSADVALPLS